MSVLCSMVGASFTVAAAAQILRSKKGITAVGNAQVDTAQSKFGGSSALFDGTGDYLSLNDASLTLGSDNWTIEFWVRLNNISGFKNLLDYRPGSAGLYPTIYMENATIRYFTNGSDRITGGTLAANTWYHIAVSKSGSDHKMFIDGTQGGSTYTAANTYIGTSLFIGTYAGSSSFYNGHIDEIRISNSARYTANFTAPTSPFVNDANTLLLIHADGTDASTFFEDDNGVRASRSLIAIGNAQIDTAQSKFGGSSYLGDGTGDYLLSTANSDYNFGTSSFTIEYWIRFNVAPTLYVPIALRPSASINNGEWWCEITNAEKKMYWGFKNQAGTQFYVNLALAGTAFTTGQWYHIALVNNAGTAQMYVDGVATGTTTALSGSFGNSTSNLWVGAGAGAYSLNGYLDEIRISNTARYTSNFTAPTAPFVNDSNTLLLIHADGTDGSTVFRDDNGARNQVGIAAATNAVISTTQSKFGGSSFFNSLSGTWGYLETKSNLAALELGTGNFTVEGWFRFDNINTDAALFSEGTTNGDLDIRRTNDNLLRIGRINTAWDVISGATGITANTWHHIAFVRNSTTLTIYVDGVSKGSGSNSINYNLTNQLRIGAQSTSSLGFAGYMDELRISNTARYTAGFTPATAPFQNDANTLLLLHCDGTDASTVFIDDNGIAPYTP